MREVVAWDTETALIRPGRHAPELTCVTYQRAHHTDRWVTPCDARISHQTYAHHLLKNWFKENDTLLVGHNVAFDLGVIGSEYPDLVPEIFDRYDRDLVTDTMLREKLLDIAAGRLRVYEVKPGVWVRVSYGLFDLAKKHLGVTLSKDTWRMFYGEFRYVQIAQWPSHALAVKEKYRPDLERLFAIPEKDLDSQAKETLGHLRGMVASPPEDCVNYPLDDARTTLGVFISQEKHAGHLKDQFRQARKAWWLHLASTWGLRTDGPCVERLRAETEQARDEVLGRLVDAGLVRKDGSRDTKAAMRHMLAVCEGPIRLTDTGAKKWGELDEAARRSAIAEELTGASLDEDACLATGDPLLEDYSTYSTLGTVLSKDVTALSLGATYPIHTHFDLAATGRTTSSAPNIQNWGKKTGARETFRPRRGYVYIVGDVDQLELRTLAQVCLVKLGKSRLAEVLNAGLDPHTAFAASLLGISYDEGMRRKEAEDKEFDGIRQGAKFTNFALPGGVGAKKMVTIARRAKIDLANGAGFDAELARAKELKEQWFSQWPEMREYFRFIESLQDPETGSFCLEQLYTERTRGGCLYTACANSWFQGLGADGAGLAGWLLARAEYVDRESPLYGSRTVNHSHDDFVVETLDRPEAHDAAVELGKLMEKGFGAYTPDVKMKVKPYLTRFWMKGAKAVYDSEGRLVPWEVAA